jgi:ubiquinone/menaquinone biosynthesis C-methylase UbiE
MWNLKLAASGVDISPAAIDTANSRYVDPKAQTQPRCVLHRCFSVASITRIPFPARSVDAVLSAGLLEHVDPKDARQGISELARVARRYLFLEISSQPRMPAMATLLVPPRGNQTAAKAIAQHYRGRVRYPVERNIRPQIYWVGAFSAYGFSFVRNIPLPGWACCAFVLKRNVSIAPF